MAQNGGRGQVVVTYGSEVELKTRFILDVKPRPPVHIITICSFLPLRSVAGALGLSCRLI